MIKDDIFLQSGFVPTLTTQVRCDNCNSILSAGPNYQPKFCPECGKPQQEAQKCPKCGADVEGKFCPECGQKM